MILKHMYALWLGLGSALFVVAWLLTARIGGQNERLAVRMLVAAAIFGFGGFGVHSAVVILPAIFFLTPDAGFSGVLIILFWWAAFLFVAFAIRGAARSVGVRAPTAESIKATREELNSLLDKLDARLSSPKFWLAAFCTGLVVIAAVELWPTKAAPPRTPRSAPDQLQLVPAEIEVISAPSVVEAAQPSDINESSSQPDANSD